MVHIKSATRLAITIGVVCISLLWLSVGIGLIPSPFKPKLEGRIGLTKSVAVSVAQFAEANRYVEMNNVLNRIRESNDDLISIGVRRKTDGRYIVASGPHDRIWKPLAGNRSTADQISVTIYSGSREWGRLEMMFQPMQMSGLAGMLQFPLPLIGFVVSLLTLTTWYVLHRTFKYLNPSEVVPTRVKSALDTLAEGLLLLNPHGEIAHANIAMADVSGFDHFDMVGMNMSEIEWQDENVDDPKMLPWMRCLGDGNSVVGQIVELSCRNLKRKFMVNATSILGAKGKSKGVLVSFDDVTALENKKTELSRLIQTLRRSRDEVERQNEQLNFLASCDPMTKCMNRRAFWLNYEQMWQNTPVDQLSIAMIDVDHFKLINDTYGHTVGDHVLIGVGELIQSAVGKTGLVCRYGGEEFAILIANQPFEIALGVADSIRDAFNENKIADLEVTASIGVSCRTFGAMDPQHMLDQADECLYAAKRNGRNQVVRFDQCPENTTPEETVPQVPREAPIQYSAVTGLLSALSFRNRQAAEHSIRVAELAVAIGPKLLERNQLYMLEIASLLHDIGKIGVPDQILNKPGSFSESEWKVMNKHDEIGIEIVRSAFASEEIAQIIAGQHAGLLGKSGVRGLPEADIPMASKIIVVCDAFDSMVSNCVYRTPLSVEDANAELRRCSPGQFDPVVVELLISHVTETGYKAGARGEFSVDATTAVEIGRHIECLCSAIESEDVELLQTAVGSLRDDAMRKQLTPITEATVRLNDAITHQGGEMESLVKLADEVLGLCRTTRNTFTDSAEATVSSGDEI